MLACPRCHGRARVIAAIQDPAEAARFLEAIDQVSEPRRSHLLLAEDDDSQLPLLIYQAKFTNMDCGVMIDHDLLTMRRSRAEMLAFVAAQADPKLERAVTGAFDAPNFPSYEELAASYRAYFAVWSKP